MRRLATLRDVPDFWPIRGREIISHKHTNRESTYWQVLLYEQRLQKAIIIIDDKNLLLHRKKKENNDENKLELSCAKLSLS